MEHKLQIYIDRFKGDSTQKIKEEVKCEELDITQEKDLIFTKPILIEGKTYLVDDNLIIVLNIEFSILTPCSICNEFIENALFIKNFYITESLSEIKTAYDFKKDVRNACFLEIPSFVECQGNCPQRKSVKKYFKQPNENYPFSNLQE